MRTHTRWLALVLVGVCGAAASAQSPVMYGMQPYPPYPYQHPYSVPQPNYQGAPQRYAPPAAYYPQPQPRVVYVPATPAPWQGAPVPAVPATRSTPSSDLPATEHGSSTIVEPNASVNVKILPARTASRRRAGLAADMHCESPDDCDPATDEACPAPKVRVRRERVHDDHTNWLPKGQWDVQILGGVFGDIGDANYNWAQTSVRLGRVWNGECFSFLPGAFEGLIDVNGASTVDSSFGNYFFGGGLIGRYNLVTLGSRVVPYVQTGIGFQYNDAYRDPNQPYLGSRIALTGQADVGFRLFLTKRLSLDLEGGYRFISGLSMSERDEGLNALGGMAGLTYFFPCWCRR